MSIQKKVILYANGIHYAIKIETFVNSKETVSFIKPYQIVNGQNCSIIDKRHPILETIGNVLTKLKKTEHVNFRDLFFQAKSTEAYWFDATFQNTDIELLEDLGDIFRNCLRVQLALKPLFIGGFNAKTIFASSKISIAAYWIDLQFVLHFYLNDINDNSTVIIEPYDNIINELLKTGLNQLRTPDKNNFHVTQWTILANNDFFVEFRPPKILCPSPYNFFISKLGKVLSFHPQLHFSTIPGSH